MSFIPLAVVCTLLFYSAIAHAAFHVASLISPTKFPNFDLVQDLFQYPDHTAAVILSGNGPIPASAHPEVKQILRDQPNPIGVTGSSFLLRINIKTGIVRWARAFTHGYRAPRFAMDDKGRVYIVSGNDDYLRVEKVNGKGDLKWSVVLQRRTTDQHSIRLKTDQVVPYVAGPATLILPATYDSVYPALILLDARTGSRMGSERLIVSGGSESTRGLIVDSVSTSPGWACVILRDNQNSFKRTIPVATIKLNNRRTNIRFLPLIPGYTTSFVQPKCTLQRGVPRSKAPILFLSYNRQLVGKGGVHDVLKTDTIVRTLSSLTLRRAKWGGEKQSRWTRLSLKIPERALFFTFYASKPGTFAIFFRVFRGLSAFTGETSVTGNKVSFAPGREMLYPENARDILVEISKDKRIGSTLVVPNITDVVEQDKFRRRGTIPSADIGHNAEFVSTVIRPIPVWGKARFFVFPTKLPLSDMGRL